MNAGRDVEQLIATWLVEEAPARAPDRVLDDAGHRIDHTRQRRFAVDWREPMIVSMGRLVAAAAIFLVAIVGAGFVGRASAPGAASVATPIASPSPSASQVPTLESYRASRDAICQRAAPSAQALNDAFSNAYDPNLSAAERSAKADRLQDIVNFGIALRAETAAIPVPPDLAAEVTANATRSEDLQIILEQEILLLRAGKVSEAQQLDLLTDPINRQAEQFEQKYTLSPCP
jgi:hypothetical protein